MEANSNFTKLDVAVNLSRINVQKFLDMFSPLKNDYDNFESTNLTDEDTVVFKTGFSERDLDFLTNKKDLEKNVPRSSLLLKFDPLFASMSSKEAAQTQNWILTESNKSFDCRENQNNYRNSAPSKQVSIKKEEAENTDFNAALECLNFELKTCKNEVELKKNMEEETILRKEVEQREDLLLKKIAEKDKAFAKLQNVVAEYEKAISEMITEKENILKQSESKLKKLKNDSEANAQHLNSLEATFSDLHIKYERTKQVAAELKDREASLTTEKKALEENLRMQEQRYEKMKNHAVIQLENANAKLEEQNKNHQLEMTKLKALLKKEEISRASIQEQLLQKSKENEELVKICDELINGGGPN